MKKYIIALFICIMAINAIGKSRKEEDKRFSLPNGIRFGYQWSNLVKNGEDAAANLNWGYIGYVRKFTVIPMVRIETGLEYMATGAEQAEDTKLQLHYLVFPAQGILKIGPFMGIAGLNGNFKIADKLTVDGEEVDIDKDNRPKSFDLAADVGVGFNFLVLTFEARYYWGLLEVQDGWYNRYWQAGLKLHF